jgi:hypothetical protein
MAHGTVLGPNRPGVVFSLLVSALCVTAAVAAISLGAVHGKDGAAFLRLMFMVASGGGFAAWFFSRLSRKKTGLAGEVAVDKEFVSVAGQPVVRRSAIRKAYVWPGRGEGAVVRIERGIRSPIDLAVKDLAEARALLRELSFDAAKTASEFSILAMSRKDYRRRFWTSVGSVVPFVGGIVAAGIARKAFGVPGPVVGAIVLVGMLAYLTMLLQGFKRTRAIIGADGIDLQWLWQRKFIPMKDIVRAEVVEGEAKGNAYPILVRLQMRNGDPIELMADLGRVSLFSNYNSFNRYVRMRAEIIAERINEVVEQRPPVAVWNTTALLREGRSIDEWVASLRNLRQRVQTFREGSALEQLWGVLEDANMGAEERAAAAVALSPDLDDRGRERIRVAARATGAPKLRVALEAAAHDDEQKLLGALDEVTETHAK